MRMLTFNIVLGYQGLLFRDFLLLFFRFFFSIRPADTISGNAFDSKLKQKGMALTLKKKTNVYESHPKAKCHVP